MRACWVATPARLGPSCPTNAPRRNKLCALEPEQQLFSSLRRQFDVDGENVAVSSGPVGRGLFFTTDTDKDTTIKIPIRNTLLVTDDPVGGSCIVGVLWTRCIALGYHCCTTNDSEKAVRYEPEMMKQIRNTNNTSELEPHSMSNHSNDTATPFTRSMRWHVCNRVVVMQATCTREHSKTFMEHFRSYCKIS